MNIPLVSVIIPTYNGARFIKETIQSALDQTYPNSEIIVIDDGSTDNTPDIIKSIHDQRMIFIRQENAGVASARNHAIRISKGDYIAFLDHDDLWLPVKLEKQIPLFERDATAGLVICDTIFFNKNGDVKRLYAKKKPPVGNIFRSLLTNYFISLETAILRRSALDSLDEWFDERLSMIEEVELFARIAYKWNVAYADEPLAKWRMHDASYTFRRRERFPKERKLMLKKFCSIFDNFEKEYSSEIKIIESQIAIDSAICDWEIGNTKDARRYLKPYLSMGIKYNLLYFLTFLPFSIYKLILSIKGIRPL